MVRYRDFVRIFINFYLKKWISPGIIKLLMINMSTLKCICIHTRTQKYAKIEINVN